MAFQPLMEFLLSRTDGRDFIVKSVIALAIATRLALALHSRRVDGGSLKSERNRVVHQAFTLGLHRNRWLQPSSLLRGYFQHDGIISKQIMWYDSAVQTRHKPSVNTPFLLRELSAELPQWIQNFVLEQMDRLVRDLVDQFQFGVDFRILLQYNVPPLGFEACMIDEQIVPLDPHEEPPYLRKTNCRAKAPRLDGNLRNRFDAVAYKTKLQTLEACSDHLAHKFREEELTSYHRHQALWARTQRNKVGQNNSWSKQCFDTPDAANHTLRHASQNAHWNEMQGRHLCSVATTHRQHCTCKNLKHFGPLSTVRLQTKNSWKVPTDGPCPNILYSHPELNGEILSAMPASNLAFSTTPNAEGKREGGRTPDSEVLQVLKDPAVAHIMIKQVSCSTKATHPSRCFPDSTFNGINDGTHEQNLLLWNGNEITSVNNSAPETKLPTNLTQHKKERHFPHVYTYHPTERKPNQTISSSTQRSSYSRYHHRDSRLLLDHLNVNQRCQPTTQWTGNHSAKRKPTSSSVLSEKPRKVSRFREFFQQMRTASHDH